MLRATEFRALRDRAWKTLQLASGEWLSSSMISIHLRPFLLQSNCIFIPTTTPLSLAFASRLHSTPLLRPVFPSSTPNARAATPLLHLNLASPWILIRAQTRSSVLQSIEFYSAAHGKVRSRFNLSLFRFGLTAGPPQQGRGATPSLRCDDSRPPALFCAAVEDASKRPERATAQKGGDILLS